MKNNIVYASLPRAGLANKLLIWSNALVFSYLNNMPLYVTGWHEMKLGPYIRREKSKRNYKNYFKYSNLDPLTRIKHQLCYKKVICNEHSLESFSKSLGNNKYIFSQMPHWSDYFYCIKNHQQLIKNSFYKLIGPDYFQKVQSLDSPCIGVHVRRSDFRELKSGESLDKSCNIRIGNNYFIDTINYIRESANKELPATIFTDGRPNEIEDLLSLPNVKMSNSKSDLLDLISLSKSKVILTSLRSTYGYWSAFISQSAIINHPKEVSKIRSIQDGVFEGSLLLDKPMDSSLKNYFNDLSI